MGDRGARVYIVEFAEEAREGDMAVVVEGGVAEDEDAVLSGVMVRYYRYGGAGGLRSVACGEGDRL